MKDYYAALGVSESASPEDIKKTYRRLAKQFHPDATGGDVKKGERFKEITEAYSVLSDKTKRAQYDQLRKSPYAADAQFGGDTGIDISEIFAQFFGGRGGRGKPGQGAGPFGNGQGRVEFQFEGDESGSMGDLFGDLLGQTGGRGRRGRGRTQQALLELDLKEAALGTVKSLRVGSETVQVRIPPGVDTGARLRAGNVSLEVRVRPHPELRREGNDIHFELPISVDEALLGAKIEVPTLDGRVTVTVPPGTSSGSILRLRGKGVALPSGGRGDELVHIRILVPKEIPPRARELMEEFRRLVNFRPR